MERDCLQRYQERFGEECHKVRVNETLGASEKWKVFQEALLTFMDEVCDIRKMICVHLRKGSEWVE